MRMTNRTRTVRIAPIALLAFIVIVCLATLCVLALTTAQAADSAAIKQAEHLSASYDGDSAAQQWVAQVDADLSEMRSSQTPPSAQEAASTLASSSQMGDGQGTVTAQNSTVTTTFGTNEGSQTIEVSLSITDTLNYRIISWQTATSTDSTATNRQLWVPNT